MDKPCCQQGQPSWKPSWECPLLSCIAHTQAHPLMAYPITASPTSCLSPTATHPSPRPVPLLPLLTTTQVAILDESCALLPCGETGEVCIQGPNVTAGYLENPKANEEAFAGRWSGGGAGFGVGGGM